MALTSDINNLIEVITLNSLSSLASPTPTIILPSGFQIFFDTTIKNNLGANLGLAPDIQQLLKTLVTDNQIIFDTN